MNRTTPIGRAPLACLAAVALLATSGAAAHAASVTLKIGRAHV